MHFTAEEKNVDFKRKDLYELVFPPLKLKSSCVRKKPDKHSTKLIFLETQAVIKCMYALLKNVGSFTKLLAFLKSQIPIYLHLFSTIYLYFA